MSSIRGTESLSGVFIADDFRDNLVIDRFDPILAGMRASKLKHMRSANSEDVVTWNVFRTLRQIDPRHWLELLMRRVSGDFSPKTLDAAVVQLWQSVSPPPSLLLTGDEGESEVDVVIEHPEWVLFIEAKLNSDVSTGTTTRPERDQLLRNIDVGSYYAGVRDFYFAFLVSDPAKSSQGAALLDEYRDHATVVARLPHRIDGLKNLRGVGLLTWAHLADTLKATVKGGASEAESAIASRCTAWLESRRIV